MYLVFSFTDFSHSHIQDDFFHNSYFIDNFHRDIKQLIYMDGEILIIKLPKMKAQFSHPMPQEQNRDIKALSMK